MAEPGPAKGAQKKAPLWDMGKERKETSPSPAAVLGKRNKAWDGFNREHRQKKKEHPSRKGTPPRKAPGFKSEAGALHKGGGKLVLIKLYSLNRGADGPSEPEKERVSQRKRGTIKTHDGKSGSEESPGSVSSKKKRGFRQDK